MSKLAVLAFSGGLDTSFCVFHLKEQGYDLKVIPYALQMNKRDLPTALPADEMYRQLNFKGEPTFEAVAMAGTGVFDTLKAVSKLVLKALA